MHVTIKDIAKMANVSPATVSMALNNKGNLKIETVNSILRIAKLLNYHPNYTARSLITKKSNCIGLIVPEIINPFYSTLVTHINNAAESKKYSLLIEITDNKIDKEKKYVEMLISKNVEGIIIIPTTENNPDLSHLYHIKNIGIPFIFCTSPYIGFSETCIMADLLEGEYLLVKHLLSHGIKRIFLIAAYSHLYYSQLRIKGFSKAFMEYGLTYDNNWIIETNLDYMSGYDVVLKIVKDNPEAIITMNDYTALGVMKALNELNIDVPEQISVAGYDDLLFASALHKPLTTVNHPLDQLGKKTIEAILNKINGCAETSEFVLISPNLQIRKTTK